MYEDGREIAKFKEICIQIMIPCNFWTREERVVVLHDLKKISFTGGACACIYRYIYLCVCVSACVRACVCNLK